MIPKETIDKIFETARVEEVVGDFVTLKRRGVNLLGNCPFHNEKTPSFTVSPTKGIYKCFGCGKGGNSVNFIMEHETLSYPDALRYLAKKYNIEILEEQASAEQIEIDNERESIFLVSAFAQKYFTEQLHRSPEGKAIGLSYFKERGFREDIIEKFQLGYSHDKWRNFTDAAIEAGYKVDYLVRSGLTIKSEKQQQVDLSADANAVPSELAAAKYFDRFSGRVMFPVHNISGRVIAFGGRILGSDKKVAKYINSPETEIYHKSNVLYGLYFAKKSIIAKENCFLVEGYTDVISLFQAGVENVVASSGTSLTVEQIRLIHRYTKNITILYDGDNAGIKASFRGINLILEEGMNVKVLLFPDGEDPDSYSKKVSSEELEAFIQKNSLDFIRFKTGLLYKETENDPIKKAELIHNIVETIALIPDAISRSVYVKECSRIMDMGEQILLTELNKLRRKKIGEQSEKSGFETGSTSPSSQEYEEAEKEFVVEDAIEYQERDIIRILVNFGNREIHFEVMDEEQNMQTVTTTVAERIHFEITHDNLLFENKNYQLIFTEVAQHLADEKVPDVAYFTQHHDPVIQQLAIDLVSNKYELSQHWERHHINVQTEEMVLKQSVYSALFSLKNTKIMKLINENQLQLKESTDENMQGLIEQLQALLEAKKHFSAQLGRIILK
ncbi:MAG: DNA primase [Bacteroidetes bacterium]|nr:DNA primase [Bacteroidota bacterium]